MEDKNPNSEIEEAKAHGGFNMAEVLGTVVTVNDDQRQTLLNLLVLMERFLPARLPQYFSPNEGTNPYESTGFVILDVVTMAAAAMLAKDAKGSSALNDQVAQLVMEVYELNAVHKRNAVRDMTRQMFGPLIEAMGGNFEIMMVTDQGVQRIDMRDEPT